MKLLIAYILSILLPTVAYAQDTTYYNKHWKKGTRENAEYYSILIPDVNNGYRIEDHFIKNNKLQMTGYCSGLDIGTTKNGAFIYYDDKGYKTEEGSYVNNNEVGEWKYYYDESEKIWYKKHHKPGLGVEYELTSYYRNGKLKRQESHTALDQPTGKCYDEAGKEIAFTPFETRPAPPFSISEYLQENLVYPKYARRNDISGRVLVKFVIKKDGRITDVSIIKGIGGGCDEEAQRVISEMPKWKPGIWDDENVDVYFTVMMPKIVGDFLNYN